MPVFPTPTLDVPWSKYPKDVYEPAEDTFLLIDALEADVVIFNKARIGVILEVCCGNGFPITSASMFFDSVLSLVTDINLNALKFARNMAKSNLVQLNAIHTSMTFGIRSASIDLLLCNPPYVPSDSNIAIRPLQPSDMDFVIDLAWKGGDDGMEFLHYFLPEASRVLRENGLLYCIVLAGPWERYLKKHSQYMNSYFKEAEIVAKRKSTLETLLVVRLTK